MDKGIILLLLSVVTCLSVGCGCGGPGSPASVAPQLTVTVTQDNAHTVVKWKLINKTASSIWIVESLSDSERRYALPIPYLVPPNELLLISGDFMVNERHQGAFSLAIDTHLKELHPSESISGVCTMKHPYPVPTAWRDANGTARGSPAYWPFMAPSMGYGLKGVFEEEKADGIRVAFKYWRRKPQHLETDPKDDLYMKVAADAMIVGENSYITLVIRSSDIVLSDRVKVEIPLKDTYLERR